MGQGAHFGEFGLLLLGHRPPHLYGWGLIVDKLLKGGRLRIGRPYGIEETRDLISNEVELLLMRLRENFQGERWGYLRGKSACCAVDGVHLRVSVW